MKKVLLLVGLFFLVLSFSVQSRELSCSLSLKEVRSNLQAYDQNNKLVEFNDLLKITNLNNVEDIFLRIEEVKEKDLYLDEYKITNNYVLNLFPLVNFPTEEVITYINILMWSEEIDRNKKLFEATSTLIQSDTYTFDMLLNNIMKLHEENYELEYISTNSSGGKTGILEHNLKVLKWKFQNATPEAILDYFDFVINWMDTQYKMSENTDFSEAYGILDFNEDNQNNNSICYDEISDEEFYSKSKITNKAQICLGDNNSITYSLYDISDVHEDDDKSRGKHTRVHTHVFKGTCD